MQIKNEIFKIECKKPTSDFLESWFKAHNIDVIRYAIVNIQNDILTLDVSYLC